jgi:3'-phosphoadenosine 5'-phosphosulfate sulfotransferase (PAPS reductase)/FAD synthetase
MKHIVGFSGGIDSQACARWVLNRYPVEDVILVNSNAGGNEHPLTTTFVAEYSAKVHPVVLVIPRVKDIDDRPGVMAAMNLDPEEELTFVLLARIYKRFPSKMAQFCTERLKIHPTLRWVRENLQDEEYVRYAGVRRDESQKRRDTPFEVWDDLFNCYALHPIADWTKQMSFDYIRQYGEPINALYSLGFERVGCAPCINSNKQDIKRWADRFPEMIDKIREWENQANRTFFRPMIPGMKIRISPTGKLDAFNWIDEVVEWSRTDHGGYQFNILSGLERPSCESKFGLCE